MKMPDINGQKVTKLDKKKKYCGCRACCFPSYGTLIEDDEQVVVNEDYMNEGSCPHFMDDLPENLEPGTVIKIKGLVLPICSRFAINLSCSRDAGSDIALHLNPRISQRYIVRNSRIRNSWGREEVTTISHFELNRNEKFQIDIVLAEKEFLVSINGKHVCAFVYRIPLASVKTLLIEGPVEVHGVEYGKTESYPVHDNNGKAFLLPTGDVQEICFDRELNLPLTIALPQGFHQGWQLEIDGRVKILPINFIINLQDGSQLWPHPNIHLHINPRFGYANTKHLFVRNAWLDGQWGSEETTEVFPFEPAAPFKLAIRRNEDHFAVWVNGCLSGEFKFRGVVDKINTLYMQGDITLKRVCMRHHVDDKFFHRSKHSLTSSRGSLNQTGAGGNS